MSQSFRFWRLVHRVSSGAIGLIALVHCAVTFVLYKSWSPNAVWFFGTGVGLFTIAVMNISHVGPNHAIRPPRSPFAGSM
jgi:hypothetical protein